MLREMSGPSRLERESDLTSERPPAFLGVLMRLQKPLSAQTLVSCWCIFFGCISPRLQAFIKTMDPITSEAGYHVPRRMVRDTDDLDQHDFNCNQHNSSLQCHSMPASLSATFNVCSRDPDATEKQYLANALCALAPPAAQMLYD